MHASEHFHSCRLFLNSKGEKGEDRYAVVIAEVVYISLLGCFFSTLIAYFRTMTKLI